MIYFGHSEPSFILLTNFVICIIQGTLFSSDFGNTPSTSSGGAGGLFGQTQTQPAGGLFSTPQSTTSAFGAKTPGFGGKKDSLFISLSDAFECGVFS